MEASWSLQSVGIQSVWGRNAIITGLFQVVWTRAPATKEMVAVCCSGFTWIYWLITNCKPKGFRSGWSIWIPWVQSYQQHVAAEVSKCLIKFSLIESWHQSKMVQSCFDVASLCRPALGIYLQTVASHSGIRALLEKSLKKVLPIAQECSRWPDGSVQRQIRMMCGTTHSFWLLLKWRSYTCRGI